MNGTNNDLEKQPVDCAVDDPEQGKTVDEVLSLLPDVVPKRRVRQPKCFVCMSAERKIPDKERTLQVEVDATKESTNPNDNDKGVQINSLDYETNKDSDDSISDDEMFEGFLPQIIFAPNVLNVAKNTDHHDSRNDIEQSHTDIVVEKIIRRRISMSSVDVAPHPKKRSRVHQDTKVHRSVSALVEPDADKEFTLQVEVDVTKESMNPNDNDKEVQINSLDDDITPEDPFDDVRNNSSMDGTNNDLERRDVGDTEVDGVHRSKDNALDSNSLHLHLQCNVCGSWMMHDSRATQNDVPTTQYDVNTTHNDILSGGEGEMVVEEVGEGVHTPIGGRGGITLQRFPLEDECELAAFNERLGDVVEMKLHIQECTIQVKDSLEMTRLVVSKVFSDELMSQYSYKGQRRKKSFERFENITKLITSTVVNCQMNQIKDKTVEELKNITTDLEKEVSAYFKEKCFKYAHNREVYKRSALRLRR